jgi:hypothetical protein
MRPPLSVVPMGDDLESLLRRGRGEVFREKAWNRASVTLKGCSPAALRACSRARQTASGTSRTCRCVIRARFRDKVPHPRALIYRVRGEVEHDTHTRRKQVRHMWRKDGSELCRVLHVVGAGRHPVAEKRVEPRVLGYENAGLLRRQRLGKGTLPRADLAAEHMEHASPVPAVSPAPRQSRPLSPTRPYPPPPG